MRLRIEHWVLLSLAVLAIIALLVVHPKEVAQTPSAPEGEVAAPTSDQDIYPVAAARKLGTATDKPAHTMPDGLVYIDVKEGKGAAAAAGQKVVVHYTGWLVNGKKFDSSKDRDEPFSFSLGGEEVIKGWDEGVVGMMPGGVRKLILPPALGYGDQDQMDIPANSVLIFEVEFLRAE